MDTRGTDAYIRSRMKNIEDKTVHLRRLDIIWICRNIHQLQWFANLLTIHEDLKLLHPKFSRPYLSHSRGTERPSSRTTPRINVFRETELGFNYWECEEGEGGGGGCGKGR